MAFDQMKLISGQQATVSQLAPGRMTPWGSEPGHAHMPFEDVSLYLSMAFDQVELISGGQAGTAGGQVVMTPWGSHPRDAHAFWHTIGYCYRHHTHDLV